MEPQAGFSAVYFGWWRYQWSSNSLNTSPTSLTILNHVGFRKRGKWYFVGRSLIKIVLKILIHNIPHHTNDSGEPKLKSHLSQIYVLSKNFVVRQILVFLQLNSQAPDCSSAAIGPPIPKELYRHLNLIPLLNLKI